MKRVINHGKDGGLLNMIRRTGPLITGNLARRRRECKRSRRQHRWEQSRQ